MAATLEVTVWAQFLLPTQAFPLLAGWILKLVLIFTSLLQGCRQQPGFSVGRHAVPTLVPGVSKGAQEACCFFPSFLDPLCCTLLRGIAGNSSTQQTGHIAS